MASSWRRPDDMRLARSDLASRPANTSRVVVCLNPSHECPRPTNRSLSRTICSADCTKSFLFSVLSGSARISAKCCSNVSNVEKGLGGSIMRNAPVIEQSFLKGARCPLDIGFEAKRVDDVLHVGVDAVVDQAATPQLRQASCTSRIKKIGSVSATSWWPWDERSNGHEQDVVP
jgi:hypothetical protein